MRHLSIIRTYLSFFTIQKMCVHNSTQCLCTLLILTVCAQCVHNNTFKVLFPTNECANKRKRQRLARMYAANMTCRHCSRSIIVHSVVGKSTLNDCVSYYTPYKYNNVHKQYVRLLYGSCTLCTMCCVENKLF